MYSGSGISHLKHSAAHARRRVALLHEIVRAIGHREESVRNS